MADEIDRACEREQQDRDSAIAAARHRASLDVLLPAVGRCYNCDARVSKGMRYCDSECGKDHAMRRGQEARRGSI